MKYMTNYINECLVCESMSYIVEEEHNDGHIYRLYRCEKCGFEWEVIDIGNGKRSV